MKTLQCLLYFVFLLSLTSCKDLLGTGTGNPLHREPLSNELPEFRSEELVFKSICSSLTTCYGELTLKDCYELLIVRADIDTELGVEKGRFENYGALLDATILNEIPINRENQKSCADEIQRHSCEVLDELGVYNPQQEDDPLAEITKIYTPVCAGVYANLGVRHF